MIGMMIFVRIFIGNMSRGSVRLGWENPETCGVFRFTNMLYRADSPILS